MTALLSVPIYQKISLTSKVMEKKYCFIVCCHAILISSQLSLHGLVIKYHELHGFRYYAYFIVETGTGRKQTVNTFFPFIFCLTVQLLYGL